ncbi:MAG: type II toxin-antitoxin system VapC family toxin [Sulfuricella sp.]|nr:type II toxin-antitoxin system VapC family toxin [Sulfuricella sp.]
MPATEHYLDTSVLIKLYVKEPYSEEAELYVAGIDRPVISSLARLEWQCAMARRQRTGAFSQDYLATARREFTRHRTEGYFRISPINDTLFSQAIDLLDAVSPIPLRSLDALHLATACALGKPAFATADPTLADAARALGLTVHTFFNI